MRTNYFLAGLLAAVAICVLPAWAGARESKADDKPASKTDAANHQHYYDCAKACDDCARICDACSNHCVTLTAQGQKHHLETARLCLDCASVCRAAGSVTARVGPFAETICTACAEACKRCGDACEKHSEGDVMMKRCADDCRRCEKACREMLKHVGGDRK